MLAKFFPQHADNDYRGSKIAIWLFGVTLFLKGVIGLNSMISSNEIASGADGIPLDTFSTGAQQTVVSMFASLGLAQFWLCVVGLVVLVRYRTLIPLMFAVLLTDQLARRVVNHFRPYPTTAAPGYIVIAVVITIMVVGLALSLWTRDTPPARRV
jgi:hypothetical protein